MFIAFDPLDKLGKKKAHQQTKNHAAYDHHKKIKNGMKNRAISLIAIDHYFEENQKQGKRGAIVEQAFAFENQSEPMRRTAFFE